MKSILLFSMFVFTCAFDTIYDLSFPTADGKTLKMSSLRGSRLIICISNARSTDEQYLKYVNSLQDRVKNLQVLVVPGLEFDGQSEVSKASSLKAVNRMRLIVTQPSWVRKAAGEKQHPLIRWLTDAQLNGHFDVDVNTTEQLFLVDESGNLIGVFDSRVSENTIARVFK
jgi:glutathione peroxidase-family protein